VTISIKGGSVKNGPHYNPENFNYNYGIVGVEAYVEPYCPFTESTKQTFNIILNYTTIVKGGFSEEEKKNIRAVPGLEGIYLRENYRYLSNFAQLENGQDVDGSDGVINPIYKQWQTWRVTGHPLIKRPSGSDPCEANSPTWRLKKINFSNTIEGNRFIARVLDSKSGEEGADALERIDASQDSNIYVPTQTSVTIPASQDSDCKNGIHWRLEKTTPLFMGQDFFVEFHRDNLSEDVANFDVIKSFQNDPNNRYQCINSNITLPGTTGDFKDVQPPANQAVKTYKPKIDKSKNIVEAWEADEESKNYYDMNRQAYYIVELGSDLWDLGVEPGGQSIEKDAKYIIFIPQNWKPTIFKIAKPEGSSKYIAYNLGVYEGIHASELFKREKFRMTVRNHLGKLVITFDGKEEEPWIVSGPDIFVVPEGKMAVWGGNIASSVMFSPLIYNQKTTMLLPPGVLGSCNGYQFGTNLGQSKLGYELNIGKVSTTGSYRRVSPKQQGIEIQEGYIYNCDAQSLSERVAKEGISDNFIDSAIGPNYLGLVGGVSTQLKALQFSSKATSSYGVESGSIPTTPIDESGEIVSTEGLLKSAIGLNVGDAKEGDEILEWATSANMVAGGHYFKKTGQKEPWILENCKTPIIPGITFSLADIEDPLWGTLNSRNRIDHRILNFTDTWSAGDYHKIDHSGGLSLYLNEYETDAAEVGKRIEGSVVEPASSFMRLEDVKKLQKRQFFISIDVVYNQCDNLKTSEEYPFQKLARERVFTGIAKNATVRQSSNVQVMDLELVDYFDVLEGKAFFNSPFFDGVRDINAVYEILRIGGFSATPQTILTLNDDLQGRSPGPAFILKQAASRDGDFRTNFDGSPVIMEPYALPQSYNRLSQPFFKPEDGANLYDIMFEFAKRSNKMMYFDRYGVFHYENRLFDDHIFAAGSANLPVEPSWAWTAIPAINGTVFDLGARFRHNYGNTPDSVQNGLLIEGEATIKYDISSCYNEFKVVTGTPDREIIIGSDIDYNKFKGNFDSRQEEQGWLGYRRPLYQAEGLFGSAEAVELMINNYSKIKNPPIEVSFQAKGLPVKALDVGVLQMVRYKRDSPSESRLVPFIITNVSSTIDPSKNSWDQTIQGEWIQTEGQEV